MLLTLLVILILWLIFGSLFKVAVVLFWVVACILLLSVAVAGIRYLRGRDPRV